MTGSKNILLVDDNMLNRRLVTAILKGLPFNVVEKGDGLEAIDFLFTQGERIDLVLLDIGMPGMSGIEICKIIRSSLDINIQDLPVIAYTAHAMKEERELYLSIGFDDILVKPMTRSDLLSTLDKYFSYSNM